MHKRFTAAESANGWAIFHQSPSTTQDDGMVSMALKSPALIASEFLDEPEAMLTYISDLLNKHWNEDD